MPKLNYKYLFLSLISIPFFFGLFPIINLIRLTLSFDLKDIYQSNSQQFSYEVYSKDNKPIMKLSKRFDVFDKKDLIPKDIKYAFISSEDKRFLSHNGIDIIGVSRAFLRNIQSGYIKEGGSTITQQVARLIFLNNDLDLKRKIKELIISIVLDIKYSKNQILKIYLNNIYLGEGAYGVNQAAHIYFGKLIEELTLSEITLLVGLAPAPSIYSPFNNLEIAKKNRNLILKDMYYDGLISKKNYEKAINEKISLKEYSDISNNKVLMNFILEEAKKKINTNYTNNLKKHIVIHSSINKSWQEKAQKIVKSIKPKNIEVALVSIDSNNGLIRAMISGRDIYLNEFNRASSSIRPLGSTFKIIPYLAALLNNKSLDSKFNDSQQCWKDYCPRNFSNKYKGKISLIDAFKSSSNIVPIKISEEVGLKKIINLANSFGLGFKQKYDEVYPLAIGAYGDSLLNITNAYSAINNNGEIINTSIIEEIKSPNGELIWEKRLISKRLINKDIAVKMKKMLEESVSEGNGIAASIPGIKILGKTGTSDGNKDLWFIGSLKNNTTGVWLGFDNNQASSLTSGNAANLWKIFIKNTNSLR